jgi:acetyltransferase-like isoleucine patch superfamily enzyme
MIQKKSGIILFIYKGFRKIYRIFFPKPSHQELLKRKQVADFEFLISKGVETELGYVTLYGEPLITKVKNSRIVMGKGVVIISDSQYNRSGINHPTVIATEAPGAEIIIGDGVGMSGSSIVAVEKIEIGKDTMLGANTNIYETDFHCIDASQRLNQKDILKANHAPIYIGRQCWLASNVTVLKGVKMGDRAVVGAMSLINKDVPEDAVAAGIPAKILYINNKD